ncbi:prion-inhibition and propagation-domain-containing protein [Plectosphaerella plurivora]|uniref:Prion-inhibition and propagation-domain-containing protein n=1 Tax=Plectosphaerella plurivora TaxID=936078 RepID=A0A9P8VA97_9PEZI|nr:prion-inhibition and propagation-domain-containing protein [Plectosphaerella plurivora]
MEVFGAIAGSLSIAAMFNNCVTCFEYIQLGRNFGRDYELSQLRLDAARVRLSRWGEAVNVNQDVRFSSTADVDDPDIELARDIFHGIAHCIQTVASASKRYETGGTRAGRVADLAVFSPDEMTAAGQALHERATGVATRRRSGTTVLKRMRWALYEGKAFDATLSQIRSLVDDLEAIFPVEAACRQLAETEVEELTNDPASFAALHDSAADIDPLVHNFTERKLSLIHGINRAKLIESKGNSDVHVGQSYLGKALTGGFNFEDRTTNEVEKIRAGDDSKVQVGNRFG